MRYNKLVPDKIPDILQNKNLFPVFHRASKKEYWRKLKEKLQEEVAEFTYDESVEEIADVFEVLDAIISFQKWSRAEISKAKQKKRKARGGFDKRIILEKAHKDRSYVYKPRTPSSASPVST